ncbi:odorant receptor 187 [Nasonia vitripennis]|uniref:Odorant receptor n=1 Tax=Nasonia vitripennis TaxID=7425 RepID=A0A7M6UVV9_NASVI|nr:odorant receptor 187 [Nasonia vitripennis]
MKLNGYDKFYYTLHKYVLTCIGLWPYQSRMSKRFFFITYGISSCSLIIALIAGLSEKWSTDPVIILENMLGIIFLTSSTAESSILYMHESKIIEFYDKIKTDWKKLTNKKEIEILQMHTRKGQFVSTAYILYGIPAFAIFGFVTFLPPILDPPSRVEYSHIFPYYFYCMIINEDFRYYQIVLHCMVSFSYASVSYLAVNCTFAKCVNHVCGIYAIICYRLQNAIEPTVVRGPFNKLKNSKLIRFNLIDVIAKHREVIHGVDMIEQIFSTGFLVIEIAGFSGIALVIADILYNQKNAYQLFRIMVVTAIFLVYIFYINWMGEQIIQVSDDVRLTAYFIDWFTLSIEAQEIIHMIVWRSCKTNKLTAGSFVALSLENFLSMLKTSWSVATVLLSAHRSQKNAHFTGYGITNSFTNSSST